MSNHTASDDEFDWGTLFSPTEMEELTEKTEQAEALHQLTELMKDHVGISLILSHKQAAELCSTACSTADTYAGIPYLLEFAARIAWLFHGMLEEKGLDPHTGEER